MSKNTSSEIKLNPSAPAAFPALKGLNLQVFVMIAAIIAIMLFFTWVTDGAYLSARNISNLLRQTAITGILAAAPPSKPIIEPTERSISAEMITNTMPTARMPVMAVCRRRLEILRALK